MKLNLPAVDEPLIRVFVLVEGELFKMDFCGERPQEVDLSIPGYDIAKAKVGYVGLAASGEEIGEPTLLYAPEPAPEPAAPKPILGKEVVITELPPVSAPADVESKPVEAADKPAADLPPETVKVEEKVEVKTTRKK